MEEMAGIFERFAETTDILPVALRSALVDYSKIKERELYLLPKPHKPKPEWNADGFPKCRPIAPNVGTEFALASKWLSWHMGNLQSHLPCLLKNTDDFIVRLKDVVHRLTMQQKDRAFIVTADIEACYPAIPQGEAMKVAEKFLQKYPDPSRPSNGLLLQLLNLQMFNNDVSFNGRHFKQIRGVSMGQSWAPIICNLYFSQLDEIMLGFKPACYFRYIDDTFFLWLGTEKELKRIIALVNSWKPSIKLNFQYSQEREQFLDVEIFKEYTDERIILHRPYFKETGKAYLKFHETGIESNGRAKTGLKREVGRRENPHISGRDCRSKLLSSLMRRLYPPPPPLPQPQPPQPPPE